VSGSSSPQYVVSGFSRTSRVRLKAHTARAAYKADIARSAYRRTLRTVTTHITVAPTWSEV